MPKSNPNLAKLIALDLLTVGRVPLILLALIFSSAMGVVFITHHSRQAISEKDQALVERERLDSEWRNLIIEETALAEHSRVQSLAKQDLEMKRPDSDKEVVITLK
ncbi:MULTISPECIES: cell division protein FtsL [Vibrio]|uniref:Cell division protein FtsL n=1 Tax=Vibrio aestuarianus TaxID=28171 RepID=A0A9X4IZE8_9VIBR|nr:MULTISPECIES: cell division protein FtsL [Vibrio]KOE81815.1 cell division protein FtsL [Vibrio alginolyticus]MBD1565242.1 cell division protein FtsL [Vibrio sp. S12_S33]MDE1210628.1 cell division protein FtsL [Vibrio aestuarianus]MDE1212265.1 cell division protein FtsL [Vibrio aestuarianus]MDE1216008.1 cell division protein FtsL [Vibrio aestuarianus]